MAAPIKDTRITVVGCGYVGVTTAAVLANCGYIVTAVERDPGRLDALRSGRSFFYEAGVNELLRKALDDGNLTATDGLSEAVRKADIVFSCVGTPDKPDGGSDLSYVDAVAADCAAVMSAGSLFVQKSTVPVGTGQRLEPAFTARDIAYASNPEFLREATAIIDTLYFDRAVAGSTDAPAAERVLDVYRSVSHHRRKLCAIAGLPEPESPPEPNYIAASLASAELIKVTANAFLALKISFANSIAKLADAGGADIVQVMDAVGADPRIGRGFLNAGRGYGGGCFPKDVSGLIRSAADLGVDMEIMQAASQVNASMPAYVVGRITASLGGSLKDRYITVLGLAFKAGTSDTRRSPAIEIANRLAAGGAVVTAYDPRATDEAGPLLHESIRPVRTAADAGVKAECLVLATDWAELISDMSRLAHLSGATMVVDCMNRLDPAGLPGITYVGVGRDGQTGYTQ